MRIRQAGTLLFANLVALAFAGCANSHDPLAGLPDNQRATLFFFRCKLIALDGQTNYLRDTKTFWRHKALTTWSRVYLAPGDHTLTIDFEHFEPLTLYGSTETTVERMVAEHPQSVTINSQSNHSYFMEGKTDKEGWALFQYGGRWEVPIADSCPGQPETILPQYAHGVLKIERSKE